MRNLLSLELPCCGTLNEGEEMPKEDDISFKCTCGHFLQVPTPELHGSVTACCCACDAVWRVALTVEVEEE